MSDAFLPSGYEVPKAGGKYTKFKAGEPVKLRILSSPILGYEKWTIKPEAIRWRMDESEPQRSDWKPDEKAKHFWAMVAWNRNTKQIEILQISQVSIQEAIASYAKNEDWGNPKEYDLTISRIDKDGRTSYTVMPSPAKPLESEVVDTFEGMTIDLQKLFTGDDPFAA
jgi:hypothetical protein